MSSEMSNELLITCAYCGHQHANEQDIIQEHILGCKKRPEYALLLKIEFLKDTGDLLLEALLTFAKAIASYDGGMTRVWEIYRAEKETWNSAKDVNAHELAEELQEHEEKEEKEAEGDKGGNNLTVPGGNS